MLGEAALTAADAARTSMPTATRSCAADPRGRVSRMPSRPSISVKLSALHPRFERAHRGRVLRELAPRLVDLCAASRDAGIALTLDAEESERLELTLELLEAACRDPRLAGWNGLGLAVQAYQKRAPRGTALADGLARETRRVLTCGW